MSKDKNINVTIFGPTLSDPNKSMEIYTSQLANHLVSIQGLRLNVVSIRGRRIPIIKDILSKELWYPIYARQREGEINHITDHSYGSLAYLLDPKRTVVTCHDLIPLEISSQSSWAGRTRFIYNVKGMLKAKNIIADSESTKNAILKYFNYNGNIHVVYPGVDKTFRRIEDGGGAASLKEKFGLKEAHKYILHVGNSNPSKNVEAVLKILPRFPDLCLIKVGRFSNRQEHFIKNSGFENRILRLENLPPYDIVEVYNIADILLMPSICEGFGFPVLEAMACGCPVICSKTTSLPEVGGEAARYIDPYSLPNIGSTIHEILEDDALRNSMIRKGFEQAAKFTWDKTAAQGAEVYREVAR